MVKQVSTLMLAMAILGGVCLLPSTPVATPVSAAALTAPALYADALGKEQAVRKAMTGDAAAASLARAVRTVLATYSSLVRLHPTSSYCDDALWRSAQLAMDAASHVKDPAFNAMAARYLKRLVSEYPASKYVRQVPDVQARLARLPQAAAPVAKPATPTITTGATGATAAATTAAVTTAATRVAPPAGEVTRTATAPAVTAAAVPTAEVPTAVATTAVTTPAPTTVPAADAAPPRPRATLLAVHRTVLPDVVRLTFDIDREVTFRQERLGGPPRIFFDFVGTVSGRSLADRTVRFDGDSDVIRQVRVGQPAADTVRVVLDATGVAACSASPLYAPYRLVVDCTRETPLSLASPGSPGAPAPTTASVPAPPGTRPAPVAATAKPKPLTPGTFARKAVDPLPAPVQALTSRITASPMAVPSILYARRLPVALATTLPAGAPRVQDSVFAGLRVEVTAAPSVEPAAMLAATAGAAVTGATILPSTPTAPNVATKPPVTPPVPRVADGGVSIARQLGLTVSRIVIDPGHGGHDPGARAAGTTEAALVLDIALRLEALLQDDGVEVILTRRTDEFVPLEERTAMANRQAADLFLSIHANASTIAQAQGVETYYLNFANSASAAAVAARENATSGQPMNALPDFVRAIALNGKQDESRDFATQVQRALVQKLKSSNQQLRDLGVKQAPFVVLIGASMPSVLAEVAFMTNEREARLLKGTNYRQRIAEALFTAIQRYQDSLSRLGEATGQE